MINQYKKINNIAGWLVFAVAAFTYLSTIEPTTSFWDCGEFISTAFKLEVGHPPGAPLFMIIGRFFTLFGDAQSAAKMVNILSALCSAFTILFLFWTITAIGRKIAAKKSTDLTDANLIAIIGSGIVGALAYTWSDSFWFSAVEGEVYAMSSFFTALVVWAIFKWDSVADEPHANRWLVFIAYTIGLSIGVHLLNLLAIPAICFIYYFRKYPITRNGLIKTGILSLVILVIVQYAIIPGIVKLSGTFELFFINTIGLPRNSGIIIYILALVSAIVFGLRYSQQKNMSMLNTSILCFAVIVIGYSSYGMIVVRSNANTPMDENNPEGPIELLSYLNREQYGSFPIFYGQYFNAPQVGSEDGSPVYTYDEVTKKYIVTQDRKASVPKYDERFLTILPRMWSEQPNHVSYYKQYVKHGKAIKITNNRGEEETVLKPTFGENLSYMFQYQFTHMYLRYFGWNFVGRQNDLQSYGGQIKGNTESGISALDNMFMAKQDKISPTYANNKGKNHYYALPLFLGLLGMFFHFKKHTETAAVTLILFLFTGLAINVYLNITPYQPRERDYAYVGSYYAFAIWIGLGVYAIFDFLASRANARVSAILATVVSFIAVPTIMVKANWNDHDRSLRFTARDFATDYLNSCAPNSIIFTNGDNDTFPLWYAQEVEGIRTDVRVVNLSLANTDWYINQLRQKYYNSEPLKLTLTAAQIRQGTRDYAPVYPNAKVEGFVDVKELMNYVASEDVNDKLQMGQGQMLNYLPTNKFSLTVNKANFMKNGGTITSGGVMDGIKVETATKLSPMPSDTSIKMLDKIEWQVSKTYMMKNDLLIMDILASNNWERPVYFAVTAGDDVYLNLQDHFQLEGLAYRLVPFKTGRSADGQIGRVNAPLMYENMMEKFKWGGMENPNIYMDENNQRMTMNLRNNFARLADELVKNGENEKALKVADKCLEVMPEKNIPYNYFILPVIDVYYKLGKKEKAGAVAKSLLSNYYADMVYYNSFRNDSGLDYEKQQTLAVIQRLLMMTKQYNDVQLSKEVEQKFNELSAIYMQTAPQQQPMTPDLPE
ncbi:MAG: DUF2723 domain-containing protein [Bacteroidia bacterium]